MLAALVLSTVASATAPNRPAPPPLPPVELTPISLNTWTLPPLPTNGVLAAIEAPGKGGLRFGPGPLSSLIDVLSSKLKLPSGPATSSLSPEARRPEKLPSRTASAAGLADTTRVPLVNLTLSGKSQGTQVGLINVAGKVGTQAGLLNISGQSKSKLGLLNLGRGSMGLRGEVYMSDSSLLNVGLRLGGPKLSAIAVASLGGSGPQRRLSLGLGVGLRLPLPIRPWVELDALGSNVRTLGSFEQGKNVHAQLKLRVGQDLAPRLSVFLAATANAFVPFDDSPHPVMSELASPHGTDRLQRGVSYWPGLELGIRF